MIVGITGGTGSGKSSVAQYLRTKGYKVIDADEIAQNLLEKGEMAYIKTVEAFGESIIDMEGKIDRKKLGNIVFSNKKDLSILETIVTKEVINKIIRLIRPYGKQSGLSGKYSLEGGIIFVDAPLLFETGLNDNMDVVWLVTADKSMRVSRLIERDNITLDEIEMRMQNQMDEKEKILKSDVVFFNNGTLEELLHKVDEQLAKYMKV